MRHLTTTLLLLGALAAPAQALADDQTVTGRVFGPNGKPLANAFVQQVGGSASTTTDDKGFFVLKLDPKGRPTLSVSAVGYLNQEIASGPAPTLILKPVPSYRPSFVAVAAEEGTAPRDHRFDTQINASYRLRQGGIDYAGRSVSGWANNELAGAARYRVGDVVATIDGWRSKLPILLAGFTPQPTPAPSVELSAWNLSAGYAFAVGGFELLPQLSFANYFITPSNNGTAYTGTPYDYTVSRQSLALGLEAAGRMGAWELLVGGRLAPSFLTSQVAASAPYALSAPTWGDAGLTVGYFLVPGLRSELTISRQFAFGTTVTEGSTVFGLGLTYHPERVAP